MLLRPYSRSEAPIKNSPCACLAEDTLREIFLWCIRGVQSPPRPKLDEYNSKLKCSVLPQLSVSRVCSTWRRVALTTPRLWTNLRFESLADQSLDIARNWLSRASPFPVSVRIDLFRPVPKEGWEENLLQFLSSYRLQDLRYQLDTGEMDERDPLHEALMKLPVSSVADLRTLDSENLGVSPCEFEVDGARYPKLTYLSLRGPWKLVPQSRVLRIFDGAGAPLFITQCWEILRGFPSLEECKFTIKAMNVRGPGFTPPPPTDEIRLPRLRVLQVHFDAGVAFVPFISPLSLPSLRIFGVYGPYNLAIQWSDRAFLSLANRSDSFPRLDALVVRNSYKINANDILEALPTLTSLSLCDDPRYGTVRIGTGTLKGLSCGQLGPKLKRLELGPLSDDIDAFLDMVECRMRNARGQSNRTTSEGQEQPTAFAQISVSATDKMGEDIRRRVKELSDQLGLNINITIQSRF